MKRLTKLIVEVALKEASIEASKRLQDVLSQHPHWVIVHKPNSPALALNELVIGEFEEASNFTVG